MTTGSRHSRTTPAIVCVAVVVVALTAGSAASSAERPAASAGAAAATLSGGLDLGPADLPETRTTSTVQPGVTLTRITRGGADQSLFWTLETLIAPGPGSPDPDAPPAVLSDYASAQAQADLLRTEGIQPRVERVRQPAVADVAAGLLGYRVRVGEYRTQAAADRGKAELANAGVAASTVYTGWDDPDARGPWHVNVVRIDPQRFTGTLEASFGADLFDREATSALARAAGARVATNGGYFVLDPASGAPGDPAGVGVYDGRLLSEPTNDRPALILHDHARGTTVRRLTWRGRVDLGVRTARLDGINRVPGFVRNCGGDSTDQPTIRPLHDVTCVDDSELVAFTAEYGDRTPAGPGREVILGRRGIVRTVTEDRGTHLRPNWMSVQGIGSSAEALAAVEVGDAVRITSRLGAAHGHRPHIGPHTTIVNGGPLLVRAGHRYITQRRDGFVHPGDPSFAYGFVLKRNPRTFAGVDARGRTVLITVDGRTANDLGLTLPEAADVARSLGLVRAINLDGGGSTTLTRNGHVVSHPSDTTGERPVGDALLVLPGRDGH
jgi:hypothetical protein